MLVVDGGGKGHGRRQYCGHFALLLLVLAVRTACCAAGICSAKDQAGEAAGQVARPPPIEACVHWCSSDLVCSYVLLFRRLIRWRFPRHKQHWWICARPSVFFSKRKSSHQSQGKGGSETPNKTFYVLIPTWNGTANFSPPKVGGQHSLFRGQMSNFDHLMIAFHPLFMPSYSA